MLQSGAVRSGFVGVVLAAALACRGEPPSPPPPEVTLFATVGELPAAAAAAAAARAGVARVRRVSAAEAADVVWLADPAEAVEAAALLAPGAVPAPAGIPARFQDPQGRFAPLCARAALLVVRAGVSFQPASVRDLADPRLAGRVALPPLAAGETATQLAALAATYGDASLNRFLELLGRNRPRLAGGEREARALVAAGEADVALVSSEEAAAAAASAASLEVVVPDQQGRGAVVLPTAVAVGARAAAKAAALRFAAWLTGPDAERLVAARAPGFMPLRADVPVPVGVRPAANVRALRLDWDRLAAERRRLAPVLAAWRPSTTEDAAAPPR